jgi:hypothetical protein
LDWPVENSGDIDGDDDPSEELGATMPSGLHALWTNATTAATIVPPRSERFGRHLEKK